ncbi:MAG TPA: class I SAM-dependent methyltransferase [Nevskiaceae bacterium]|nr:class I SAM-dependent methyltransferase [Nevskiaceae bacterium]
MDSGGASLRANLDVVEETRFGVWFLGTQVWKEHVLQRAIKDLRRLAGDRMPVAPILADVGCGSGQSFSLLCEHFAPRRLIGVDVDPAALARAAAAARGLPGHAIDLHRGTSAAMPLPSESVDVLFCHQTFHHFVDQDSALAEFRRVLRPGGLLLFAESTRAYIHSWIIRLLFRHPMDVQKTAPEYLAMVRAGGFTVADEAISYPYLWWSRSDLGVLERWFRIAPRPQHEETLINLVAVRK